MLRNISFCEWFDPFIKIWDKTNIKMSEFCMGQKSHLLTSATSAQWSQQPPPKLNVPQGTSLNPVKQQYMSHWEEQTKTNKLACSGHLHGPATSPQQNV